MLLFKSDKTKMVSAEDALPGRNIRRSPFRHAMRSSIRRCSRRSRTGSRRLLRPRLLLGRGAALLGARRRLHDRGRLHRTDHAEPDLRGGLHRQDRPRRGGAGRLRPGEGLLRGPAQGLLRGARPDPGHAPGQRRRHPVPLRRSTSPTTPQKATAEMALRRLRRGRLRAAGHEPVTTEIEPAGPFYYAEDYHQQYLHKVPNGYCGLKGTGVSCAISFDRS